MKAPQLEVKQSNLFIRPIFSDERKVRAFTPREEEVVRLLMEGLTDHEIARRMFISSYTVKVYMRTIKYNLGVSSRLDIIIFELGRRSLKARLNAS